MGYLYAILCVSCTVTCSICKVTLTVNTMKSKVEDRRYVGDSLTDKVLRR